MQQKERAYNKKFDEDLKFGEAGQDWLLWLADDATIEIKTERDKWAETGNIFIEFECREKPSGITATTATYWAHILYKNGKNCGVLVFRTAQLKENLKKLYNKNVIKAVYGGDDNASRGFLVKLELLSKLYL